MKLNTKSFTLIELLIVIGILSILIVTILVTLNPAEAQKKARDAKRMKDLSTLVAIVEQHINAGNASICIGVPGCLSTDSEAGIRCDSSPANWLSTIVSNYCTILPIDPRNGQSMTHVKGATTESDTENYYRVKMSGGDYEVNVRQESVSNASNVNDDGGNSNEWVEAGSDLEILEH